MSLTAQAGRLSHETEPEVIDLCDDDDDKSVELVGTTRAWHGENTREITPEALNEASRPRANARKRRKILVPAMQRGARPATCLNDVDQRFESLRAEDRTSILRALFASAATPLRTWRAKQEKCEPLTLWGLVAACYRENAHLALREQTADVTLPPVLEDSRAGNVTTASAVAYMRRRLAAIRDSADFDRQLAAVESVTKGDYACSVCMEDFQAPNLVFCGATTGLHAVCRRCFNGLCTRFATDKGVGSAAVACPEPTCEGLFSRRDVVSSVSPLDLMIMDERERDSSMRVGLGGAKTLRCACGATGTVSQDEAANGVIDCPSCSRVYCVTCGNDDHRPRRCPLPDEDEKWIAAKTKQCPKCSEAIEKNAGCAHMTCRCGHQFCWVCLGDFPRCHCGHFEQESRREALRLQLQDIFGALGESPGAVTANGRRRMLRQRGWHGLSNYARYNNGH